MWWLILPAELVAKLRDLHARGIPIESDPAFFHFGAAWLSESNSLTTSWKPTASVAIWDECYVGVLAAIAALPPPPSGSTYRSLTWDRGMQLTNGPSRDVKRSTIKEQGHRWVRCPC
jgi:hypothetical protein